MAPLPQLKHVPGTNFFTKLDDFVNIAFTDGDDKGVFGECNGKPSVVAMHRGVYVTGFIMRRIDTTNTDNLYVNTGDIFNPVWTLIPISSASLQADWTETNSFSPSFIKNHYVVQTGSANGAGIFTAITPETNWLYVDDGTNTISQLINFNTLEYDNIVIAPQLTCIGGGVTVDSLNNIHLTNGASSVFLDALTREFIIVRYDVDLSASLGSPQYVQVGGKVVNSGLTSLTYIAMDALITANGLVPGAFYEINDFQTIAVLIGPLAGGTIFGAQEPLIVQATSTSTISKQAWSAKFPKDLIEYDFIDSTSANPGVLIPNGNMGRISYREDTTEGQNRSTPYDFREICYYHPKSLYSFVGISFPITLTSVDIDGFPNGLVGTYAGIDEVVTYLKNPSSLLFCIPTHLALSFNVMVFSLFNNSNATAGKWGNLHLIDSGGIPRTIVPTITEQNYYTFGNVIQPQGGNYSPAANGNQIGGRTDNVHLGVCSDGWSGQVMNNIIFGASIVNWKIGNEVINGVVSDTNWDGNLGDDCYGFVVGQACFGINVGKRNGYQNAQLYIDNFAIDLKIGDNNLYEIITPINLVNWEIGPAMSYSAPIDLTTVVSLTDRVLRLGYSNMDKNIAYNAAGHSIPVESWVGIAYTTGTALIATDRLDTIVRGPTKFPLKVMPKLSYFTFAVGNTLVPGDKITGTLTGAKGQIVNRYTTPLGTIQYNIETWTGDFSGETIVTAGVHVGNVVTFTGNERLTLDPAFCDPSLIVIAAQGNIKLNAGSPPIFLDGKKGAYILLNNDNADASNFYQVNAASFL